MKHIYKTPRDLEEDLGKLEKNKCIFKRKTFSIVTRQIKFHPEANIILEETLSRHIVCNHIPQIPASFIFVLQK